MALVLTLTGGAEDYILISHGGESIRIQVHKADRSNRPVVAFLADVASGGAPPASWQFVRKAVREREGG
jgi:hypothetical protein